LTSSKFLAEPWLGIRTGYVIFVWESRLWTLRTSPIPGWGLGAILIPITQSPLPHQLNRRLGGELLNFEVTVGLGRLLHKKKIAAQIAAQIWNFKLPWAQRRLGPSKVPFRDIMFEIHYAV
jgi:hypothetical protein